MAASETRWLFLVMVVVGLMTIARSKPHSFYDLDEEEMQDMMENLALNADVSTGISNMMA